jgi:hypothetical protein
MKRIEKAESDTSMRMPGIINPFPEFVKYLVCRLKQLCPVMGKVRIAQILARAGLHLGTTTIERYLKDKHPKPESVSLESFIEEESPRAVSARGPDHVWHVDLTTKRHFWACIGLVEYEMGNVKTCKQWTYELRVLGLEPRTYGLKGLGSLRKCFVYNELHRVF